MGDNNTKSAFCDPYAVFGATLDTPLSELRSTYYALSLICHPDKGGRAEDMIALRNAYEVVRAGQENYTISHARMAGTDISPPSFADVWQECHGCDDPNNQATMAEKEKYCNGENHQPFTEAEFMAAVEGNQHFVASSIPGAPDSTFDADNEVANTDAVASTDTASETIVVKFRPMCRRDLLCKLDTCDENNCFDFSVDAPLHMHDLDSAFSTNNAYAHDDARLIRSVDAMLEELELIDKTIDCSLNAKEETNAVKV